MKNKIINTIFVFLIAVLSTGVTTCMKNNLDKSQEELLQNIEQFNKTIGEKGWNINGKIIENKNLNGIHLVNSTLDDVDLISLDFASSRFDNTNFLNSTFKSVNMSKSVFMNCTFRGCTFENTKFSEATFFKCHFSQNKLNNVELSKSTCQGSDWNDIDAKDVNWRYARLISVLFSGGTYENVVYANSILDNVIFNESKLTKSGFNNSELKQCSLKIEGNGVNFLDSKFDHLTITGSPSINDLKLAGIKGANLIIENLNDSEFFTMSFCAVNGFQLRNSNLKLISCISASFTNSIFQNTSFNFAQFDGSKFTNASFDNITFFDEIIFDDSIFEGTRFTNVKKSSDYHGSFKNTIFDGKEPF